MKFIFQQFAVSAMQEVIPVSEFSVHLYAVSMQRLLILMA